MEQRVCPCARSAIIAKDFVVVAPFASKGEPIAEESSWRWKPDRYGNDLPYVDSFKADLTWESFIGACELLGQITPG